MRIIEQTREEKIAMYMRLTKREIAGMLVNSSEALDNALKHVTLGQPRESISISTIPNSTIKWLTYG